MPSENYFDFIGTLESFGLLYPGEGDVLARINIDNRGRPGWYKVLDICATRAAHKTTLVFHRKGGL